jgi:hypothetical protein
MKHASLEEKSIHAGGHEATRSTIATIEAGEESVQ